MKTPIKFASIVLGAALASLVAFAECGGAVGQGAIGGIGGGSGGGAGSIGTCNALTYASTTNVDFSGSTCQTLALTGDVTLTTSNLTASRVITLKLTNANSYHAVTWPAWQWGSAKPTVLGPSATTICTLTSFGTTNASVVASCVGDGVPGIVQHLVTRMRAESFACPTSTTIKGTRRVITTTSGNYLDVNYHASGVTNVIANDANFGISISVDGNQPEFSLRHQHTTADQGGWNLALNGGARVHITPSLTPTAHTVFLSCHELATAFTYSFEQGSFSQQEENGLDLTIDEVREAEWWPTQLTQESGVDDLIIAWFKADDPDIVVDGSDRVTTWPNHGTTGGNATQSVSGHRPLLVANCQNGLPCLRFTEAREDGLDFSMAQQQGQHVYAVIKHNDQTGKDPPLWNCDRSGVANCEYAFVSDTSGGGHANAASIRCDGAYKARTSNDKTGLRLLDFRSNINANVAAIRVDKDGTESTDFSCATPGTMISIGSDSLQSFDGFDGDIMEFIVVGGPNTTTLPLTATDDNYIRDYLNRRWGVYTENVGL